MTAPDPKQIAVVIEQAAQVADRCVDANMESARRFDFGSVEAQKYRARASEASIIADGIRRLAVRAELEKGR